MLTPLKLEFDELQKTGEIENLEAVMAQCRSLNAKISVTVVGAGDAFINRYWPTLLEYVNQGKITLTVVDQGNLGELAERKVRELLGSGNPELQVRGGEIRERYQQLEESLDIEEKRSVEYFDLDTAVGKHNYEILHITNLALILVPDHIHLREARKWLHRASMIFIEKPYASSSREAQEFELEYQRLQTPEAMSGGNAFVIPFDHYFAKIMPYIKVQDSGRVLSELGTLESIEFVLTESRPPETHRLETLGDGLIADLYPHALAAVSTFADISSITQRNLQIAKLEDTNLKGETYAHINCEMRDYNGYPVTVNSIIGKGIGKQDEKYMIVKGKNGQLVINFSKNDRLGDVQASLVRDPAAELNPNIVGKDKISGINISGHKEFLDSLLSGNYLVEPCGGLTRKQAYTIMMELDDLREGVNRLGEGNIVSYSLGAEKLLKRTTEVPMRRW